MEIGTTKVGAVGYYNYVCEGVKFAVFQHNVADTVPFYRYWNGVEHFYTIDANEIGVTTPGVTSKFYCCEGILGYVYSTAHSNAQPLYRYY